MAEYTTAARPYARAVYQQAKDTATIDSWSDALALLTAVVTDEAMRDILDDPKTGRDAKGETVLHVVGDSIDPQQSNLVRLMAENGRLKALPDVAGQFEVFRAEAEGKIEAEVVSAFDLSPEQQASIASTLRSALGRDVSITVSTDASLIGGVVIKAGDTIIDASMRSQLEALALTLGR